MPIILSEKPLSLEQHLRRVESLANRDALSQSEFNKLVKSKKILEQHAAETTLALKDKNPLAWCKPSYLQSLKLNSWMTGKTFLLDFESNRQGKTAITVVRIHLFMCPPQPIAHIFKPHSEQNPLTSSQLHLYQVLPPPSIARIINLSDNDPIRLLDPFKSHLHPDNLPLFLQAVQESELLEHIRDDINKEGIYEPSRDSQITASFLPTDPDNLLLDAQLPSVHQIWHCSPDHKKFKKVCAKAWQRWTPASWITSYQEHEGVIKIQYPNGIKIEVVSMSYDSPSEKFAGDAVRAILMTEGPPNEHWNEIKLRFEYPALGSFDFTPVEPSNTNSASHLAEQIYKKKEEVPLSPIVFSGFGIEFAPPHILPPAKKADLIRLYRNKPEGIARLDGKFYTNVPKALHALDREVHCLPLTFNEFVKQNYPNFQTDPSIKFRGYDEGSDSPSACVWGALMPDNVWVIYRAWQQAQLTISQRVKRIIELSGNERKERRQPASGTRDQQNQDKWWIENQISEKIVMTIADYHIFKKDQNTGKTHARNYVQEGLLLRASITEGPETRVLLLNNKLSLDEDKKPKIVFLMKEPGVAEMVDWFEEWYWERYVQGPNKDQPKDKVSDKDDHLADALSYIVLSPFRWSPSLARTAYNTLFSSKPDAKYLEELKEFFENAA